MHFVDTYINTVRQRIELAERRYALLDEFRRHRDPNMRIRAARGGPFFELWWTDWTGWNSDDLPLIHRYLKTYEPMGGPMTQRIMELTESDDDFARTLSYMIRMSQGDYIDAPSLTENSSFEQGSKEGLAWSYESDGGRIERVNNFGNTGYASLIVEGVREARISQVVKAKGGLTGAQVRYFAPEGTRGGTIQLELHSRTSRGETLTTVFSPMKLLAAKVGEWASLELIDVLSSGLDRVDITEAEIVVIVRGATNTRVYIDDVVVFQNVPMGTKIKSEVESEVRPNLALARPVKASSFSSTTSSPVQAVDGDLTTGWVTETGAAPPHWLEIDLQGRYTVDRVDIWTGFPGQRSPYSIAHMKLQFWTEDGWEDITGASIEGNWEEHVTFMLDPSVKTDKIRFVSETKQSPDGLGLRFRELLIFGTEETN